METKTNDYMIVSTRGLEMSYTHKSIPTCIKILFIVYCVLNIAMCLVCIYI